MKSNKNNNLVIDWDLATKLAGNKREIAEELLQLLMKNLLSDMNELKELLEKKDYKNLEQQTHKLHGALCYCGVPRLKNAAALLETALKQKNPENIFALFMDLEMEAQMLLHYRT